MKKILNKISMMFFMTLIFSVFSFGYCYGETVYEWKTKAITNNAKYWHDTVVLNGQIYAIGGYNGKDYTATVEAFDPETTTWLTKASMNEVRCFCTSVVLNGRIYVIGGYNGKGCTATVEEYNPATNTWTTKASMKEPRYSHATVILNNKIYAIGGNNYNGAGALSSVEEYDPTTNTWTTKASMKEVRDWLTAVVLNGKIYAIGGRCKGVVSSSVEEFDPTTNTWSAKASMKDARFYNTTEVLNNKLYVIGGRSYNDLILSTVEEYSPTTNTWITKASMNEAKQLHSTAILNNKIYAIGGTSSNIKPQALASVEEFDPISNIWSPKANMKEGRYEHTTAILNNKLYAIGGTVNQHLSIEEYTPVIKVSNITLNKTSLTLLTGNSETLIPTITPNDTENKTLTWTSSTPKLATVDTTGKVTAVAPGTATITATTQDGTNLTVSCSVTVTDPAVLANGITLNKTNITLSVGDNDQLAATITPSNVSTSSAIWSSSDSSIASVDSTGKVSGLKVGTATITAATMDGSNLFASCVVNVISKLPQGNLNLSAMSSTSSQAIALNWNNVSGALGYKIKRTTSQAIAYDTIASNVSGTSYIDTNVQPGMTYYYIIVPVNDAGEGANSNEASATVATLNKLVLNIEPEKTKIKLNETVSANVVIDNIQEIAAEDIRIKYDSSKLQFLNLEEIDGIKLVKNDTNNGEIRVILASKGKSNIVNSKKILLKLNFKGIAIGDALVDISKGRVSDGITYEKDLEAYQCGKATIKIEELKDVNNTGEFTLLDLAIDARHLKEAPSSLPQYNTDIEENNAIDENDLLKIGKYMLENPNYKF